MGRKPRSTGTSRKTSGPSSARRAVRIVPPRASSSRREAERTWLPGRGAVLSPRHAHVPGERRAAVAAIDDEIVPLGLARNGFADGCVKRLVALGSPQGRAQIGGILLPEAHVKGAGAGEADAVAGLAEIMRKRRDEAEP